MNSSVIVSHRKFSLTKGQPFPFVAFTKLLGYGKENVIIAIQIPKYASCFPLHRAHLEANAEKWNRLLMSLEELIKWLNMKDEELKKQMPIGGDVPALQLQYDHCKVS